MVPVPESDLPVTLPDLEVRVRICTTRNVIDAIASQDMEALSGSTGVDSNNWFAPLPSRYSFCSVISSLLVGRLSTNRLIGCPVPF